MIHFWGVKHSVVKELISSVERSDQNALQNIMNVCCKLELNYQGKKKDKQTALMRACKKGDAFIVQTLLSCQDVDVNLVDHVGNTALIIACEEGHADAVRALLSRHEINVNTINETGNSALTWACILGHTSIARQLINHPAIDVNGKSQEAHTPLMCASRNGKTEIVRMLVEHPDINMYTTDLHGLNALDAANKIEIQTILLKKGLAPTPMRTSVSSTTKFDFPVYSSEPFELTEEPLWPVPDFSATTVTPFSPQSTPTMSTSHDVVSWALIVPISVMVMVFLSVVICLVVIYHIQAHTEHPVRMTGLQHAAEQNTLEDTILSLKNQNSAHLCTIQALQGTIEALTMQVASLQVQNTKLESNLEN